MPVILALVLALTAAVLNVRITSVVQSLLDQTESNLYADQSNGDAYSRIQKALEILALPNNQHAVVSSLRSEGWQVEESGRFFNPLVWMGWSDEQRIRFARKLSSNSSTSAWLERLEVLKKCLPEKPLERLGAFDDCTGLPLFSGMALFPESTPLNLNEASLIYLKMMLPEASDSQWGTLEHARQQAPFVSMADFSERLPEIASISSLPGGLDVKSRYLWLRWKGLNRTIVWLVDRQGGAGSPRILFTREG